MSKLHVRKGDQVVVIAGKERGAKGEVTIAIPKKGRVVVEGINKVVRHTKPKKMGQVAGRVEKEAPIDASNVMLWCSKCSKGVRVNHQVQEKNGKRISVRICKKCGTSIG